MINYIFFIITILSFSLFPDAPTKTNNSAKAYKKTIKFNYTDKPIIEIINELAAKRNVNIILPQGANAIPATLKVTINFDKPLSLNDAWNQLIAILELAGYTVIPENDIIEIKKIDQNILRESLKIYIDQPLEKIPDTEEVIRALFYLRNLSLKVNGDDISAMLKDMLSTTADIKIVQNTNSLILTDKANNIISVMKIIQELDRGGIRDSIEVLPLYYTSSQIVQDLFNKKLLVSQQQQQQPGGGAPQATQEEAAYFPKNTKILGLDRTNSLIIMGTPYAINLVKDFVIKYIDRPLESGESILHIYDLQYLNAEKFAPILESMLKPAQTDQATGQTASGPKQYFKDVIVRAEKVSEGQKIQQKGTATGPGQLITEGATAGGNRLVVSARRKDWLRIKSLIDELDKPDLQVALEVLVVDISLNNNKLLGNQMRNKQGFNDSVSKNVDWQSAQLSPPVLKMPEADAIPTAGTSEERPPDALMSNLLQLGSPFDSGQNMASASTPGSLLISLSDPQSGVWSVWQILNRYANTTILSQPFIVTKNHQQATVKISQQRLLPGDADTSNVAVKVNNQWVTADLTVEMLPHISLTNNINLQITINVNEFTSEAFNTRVTRVIQTNTNIGSNQILALGGLTRTRENTEQRKLPVLGHLPLLGWWFKREQKVKERNNLVIFICPRVMPPKTEGGTDEFTDRKLEFAKQNIDEDLLFQNLKDPITRWFFKPEVCQGEKIIEDYTQRTLREQYEEQENDNTAMTFAQNNSSQKQQVATTSTTTEEETSKLKEILKHETNPLTNQATLAQADPQS